MPTYDYRCKDCGTTHEIQQGFNDERPTVCPTCGGHLTRVFHPVGVVFKGSGFHKTDYTTTGTRGGGSETSGSKGDGAAASTPDSSKTDSPKPDSSKADKPKSDSTPAAPATKSDPKPGGSA